MTERAPGLVLGEGNTALGALRALSRRGTPAYVTRARDYVAHSRWYRPWPGAAASEPAAEALAGLLGSSGVERAVLIPCSDPWVRAVSALPAELSRRYPASVAPPGALQPLVDKALFAERLERLGIPHPTTRRLLVPHDVGAWPEALLRRSFLKPADSYAFQQRFGAKAFPFESPAAAEELAARALDAGLALLLQEYVPGPPDAHYFVDGFVDRAGRIVARFPRRRLRMWPPDFGNSSAMVSVPSEEVAPALDSLDILLGDLGYRGVFSAEFKRDPRDGLFRLLEVNARVWKYVDFAAACGVDVCTMAWHDALEEPVEEVTEYRVGATCVDTYFDRPACLQQLRRGELGLGSWARSWLVSRKVTFAWDDPLPALGWLLGHLARRR